MSFIQTELRSVGTLTPATIASGETSATLSGTVTIPRNTAFFTTLFQAHLLAGGSGNTATAQLVDSDTAVYATLVLTQAGTFAIENQGKAFGPVINPTAGSTTLSCRVINATAGDQFAVTANLEQAYVNPVA